MNEGIVSKNPQVLKIVHGKANWELLTMLMNQEIGFTPEEYLESLVFVLAYNDLRNKALVILENITEAVKKTYVVKRDANERVCRYILDEALISGNFSLLSVLLQNKWLPDEFMLKMAEKGDGELLAYIVLNPLPLVANPEIMEKMAANPRITPEAKVKLAEIQEIFFDKTKGESQEIPFNDDIAVLLGDNKEHLTTLQRINRMSIAEKIQLAFKAGKTERLILMKDANRMVQSSVIESPKLSEDEVIGFANDRSIPGEIIGKIAENRDWTKNYAVVMALVQNPKVPVSRAVSFIKQLHERDLRIITLDKNVSPVIRQLAVNFLKSREQR